MVTQRTAGRMTATRTGPGTAWATGLTVVVLTAIGLGVRLFQVVPAAFPVGDGGLFHAFIRDLLSQQFALPLTTSYNAPIGAGPPAAIPFAYPPLMFYIGAALNRLAGLSIEDVLRLLPALLNALTAPAIYALARSLGLGRRAGLLAALAFALMPGAFSSTLSGGGLTRSGGLLFGVIALTLAASGFHAGVRRPVTRAALAGAAFALSILAHPQMGLTTGYSLIVFWLFLTPERRSPAAIGQLALTGAFGVIGAAPWWATVLARYGPGPLLSATGTGALDTRLAQVLTLPLGLGGAEPSFWGFLALMGAALCLADRRAGRLLLPVWLLAMFAIDTRVPVVYASVPLALLAAVFLDEGALRLIDQRARLARAALLIALIGTGLITALDAGLTSLSADSRAAMAWVAANTPAESTFIVFSSGASASWFTDALDEWFPELTGRVSAGTVQGREWQPGFLGVVARYQSLNACARATIACAEDWAAAQAASVPPFTHVYIATESFDPYTLRQSLDNSSAYRLIHAGPGALIYARIGPGRPVR